MITDWLEQHQIYLTENERLVQVMVKQALAVSGKKLCDRR